jgi:peptide/nickel transport system ATP-binding protein
MRGLSREFNTAVLLITHDLGVVAEMAQEVAVMYTGQIVERGSVFQVLKQPLHPYTMGLLNSIPGESLKGVKLNVIRGSVPNPLELPKGCTFSTRCPFVMDICTRQEPKLLDVGESHLAHCWLYQTPNGQVQIPMQPKSWDDASRDFEQRVAAAQAKAATAGSTQ